MWDCRDKLDKCGSGNQSSVRVSQILEIWRLLSFTGQCFKNIFFRVDASFIFPWPVNLTTQNHKPYPKVDSKCSNYGYSKRILLDIVQNAHQFLLFNVIRRKTFITRFTILPQSIKSVSIILKDLSIIIFTLPINLIIVTQRNNKMQNRWYEMSAQKTQSDLIGYRIFSTADMHLNTNGPSGKLYSWNPRPEGSYFSQKLLTRSWYLWTTRVN